MMIAVSLSRFLFHLTFSLLFCFLSLSFSSISISSSTSLSSSSSSSLFSFVSSSPSYCTLFGIETYNCNPHQCCETAYNCGCTSRRIFSNCPYDSCGDGGCWCSPLCRCCRTDDCGYQNCRPCFDQCTRTACLQTVSYEIESITPTTGSAFLNNSEITITGGTFVNTQSLICIFTFTPPSIPTTSTPAYYISDTQITCFPPLAPVGTVATVEVSMDSGLNQTRSGNFQYRYQQCPGEDGECNEHGRCNSDGSCTCESGFYGSCCREQSRTAECSCPWGKWGPFCEHDCPYCEYGGQCDVRGKCQCVPGTFGTLCENLCPGAEDGVLANTCNGRGVCHPLAGECNCLLGYWGAACEHECPGGQANPCSGHGSCNQKNGTCLCDNTYAGTQCTDRYCDSDCNQGNLPGQCPGCYCRLGQCHCSSEFTGIDCKIKRNSPLQPNTSVEHGVVGFAARSVAVQESVGSFRIYLNRTEGFEGRVSAIVSTESGSATSAADFLPLKHIPITWADGVGGQSFTWLYIMQDLTPENDEYFTVRIESTEGGAILSDNYIMNITILANDAGLAKSGSPIVQVQIRLLMDYDRQVRSNEEQYNAFVQSFTSDVATALRIDPDRVVIEKVEPNTVDNTDSGTLVTFQIGSSIDIWAARVGQCSDELIRQVSTGPNPIPSKINPAGVPGAIYDGSVTKNVDPNFMPIVFTMGGQRIFGGGGGSNTARNVLIAVLVILLLGLAVGAGVAYWKRVPLSEWLLWKLGNFRFGKFKRSINNEEEEILEDDGARALDDRPLSDMDGDD